MSCVMDSCFLINVIDTSKTCISNIIVTKKVYKTYHFFDTLSWLNQKTLFPIISPIDTTIYITTLDSIKINPFPAYYVQPSYPTYWLWEFGDGTKSTTVNPVHKYKNTGRYKASLTKYVYYFYNQGNNYCLKFNRELQLDVPCQLKCSETKYFDVVVDSLGCRADFTYKWLRSNKMLFTDISQYSNGSDSTIWDFGDGTKAIGKQVIHAFKPREKEYKVCMNIKANGCISDGICGECMLTQCRRIIINYPEIPADSNETSAEAPTKTFRSKLFPNPAKEDVTVEVMGLTTPFDLTIYNNAGILVKKITNMNETNNTFSAKDMKTGLYFYTIFSEGKIISKDKVLVE